MFLGLKIMTKIISPKNISNFPGTPYVSVVVLVLAVERCWSLCEVDIQTNW